MTITSACLSIDFVKRLIQDHLNTNVLRCPHTITDLDLVAETDTVVVTLEPLITRRTPAGDWQPITVEELARDLVEVPANGNGHHTPEETTAPQPTAEAPKSRKKRISALTPELRAAILARHAAGIGPTAIAAELNVGTSTAARVIAQARRDGAV